MRGERHGEAALHGRWWPMALLGMFLFAPTPSAARTIQLSRDGIDIIRGHARANESKVSVTFPAELPSEAAIARTEMIVRATVVSTEVRREHWYERLDVSRQSADGLLRWLPRVSLRPAEWLQETRLELRECWYGACNNVVVLREKYQRDVGGGYITGAQVVALLTQDGARWQTVATQADLSHRLAANESQWTTLRAQLLAMKRCTDLGSTIPALLDAVAAGVPGAVEPLAFRHAHRGVKLRDDELARVADAFVARDGLDDGDLDAFIFLLGDVPGDAITRRFAWEFEHRCTYALDVCPLGLPEVVAARVHPTTKELGVPRDRVTAFFLLDL